MNSYIEWLKRAKSALELSKAKKADDIYYEDLCFQAQQAAEKALKALFLYHQIEPPRSHSLVVLINGIKRIISIPGNLLDVVELTDYAVQTRYPGDYTPITEREYERAVELAEITVDWVERKINH